MRTIKISKLIEQENIASSITVCPVMSNNTFVIHYQLKTRKIDGSFKRKSVKVDFIIHDVVLPSMPNGTVKHLGYTKYFFYENKSTKFYINIYDNK